MADIAQLLSNAAETKADFNFGKLNDAYWAGLENAYKQRARDAFQDIDLNSPQGFNQAAQRALQVGGLAGAPAAKELSAIDFQRQQIQAGEKYRGPTDLFESGGNLYGGGRGAGAAVLSPPSISGTNTAPEKVQQDMTQGRQSSREPLQPPAASSPPPGGHTVMTYANASGIPNNQLGAVSESIANQLGVGPNDRIDTNDPQVRNVLVPAIQMQLKKIKDMGIGQTYAPGQPTPPPQVIPPVNPQMAQAGPPQQSVPLPRARPPDASQPQQQALDFADRYGAAFPNQQPQGAGAPPQAQPAPVQAPPPQVAQAAPPQAPQDISAQSRQPIPIPGPLTAPLTGTQRQAPMSRAEQGVALYTHMLNDPMLGKEQKENAMARLKYFQTMLEPTSPMKEYAQAVAQGFKGTQQEYEDQNRDKAAEIAANQSILTTSILPKLDKSQTAAVGLADSVNALHQARTQIDSPGGIFAGTGADIQKKLAKVASMFGVPNSDKITNTEAFGSAIGERVLGLVKGLGTGSGVSNTDREFAAAMAGGNISLNETSIRRILDIGEKSARARIDRHNKLVDDTVSTNEYLKGKEAAYRVAQPGEYVKQLPPGAPQGAKQARDGFYYIPDPARPGKFLKWIP